MSLWGANVIETSQPLRAVVFPCLKAREVRLNCTDRPDWHLYHHCLTEKLLISLQANVLLQIHIDLQYAHPDRSACEGLGDEPLEEYNKTIS